MKNKFFTGKFVPAQYMLRIYKSLRVMEGGMFITMSTLESTISLIKVLPESDLIRIQDFAKKLFQMHECESVDEAVGKSLKPMSREDIYEDLEVSRQQISRGEYRDAKEFIAEARREYGI